MENRDGDLHCKISPNFIPSGVAFCSPCFVTITPQTDYKVTGYKVNPII